VPPSIWLSNRAPLLFTLVTATVVIWLMTAAGARADSFDDAQAALEQAVAQTGGAPSPVSPAQDPASSPVPVKKIEEPKKSWGTGGVAAPSAATPAAPTSTAPPAAAPEAPSNVNISIRVQSPGNDGPVIQQDDVTTADIDRLERDLNVKFKRLERQLSKPAPRISMPAIHYVAVKRQPPAKPKPKPVRQVAPKPPDPTPETRDPVQRAAAPVHERHVHKQAAPTHPHPFQLPQPSDNQAMSAGSSGGTSTPPPAPIAALLAAACLAASMLVTTLWDAHRRRRSRLFASRLERPG
jgi:hypothetical protein